MELVNQLFESLIKFRSNVACHINGYSYTYSDLSQRILDIRYALKEIASSERIIGLVARDDMATYAAILALWFEGKAYVPISPGSPKERNQNVINQALISTVIDASEEILFKDVATINSNSLERQDNLIQPHPFPDEDLAYIIFTSGTTGSPKGVPITRGNLSAYIYSLEKSGYQLDSNDRCLQMFELTFDFSVMAYLFPLLRGASMYTIPKGEIKFSYIYKLITEFQLTALPMVPSVINFLRPFFSKINSKQVRYSIFCGEALHSDVTFEWSKCIPNAEIYNYYGPTECTVFCSFYKLKLNKLEDIKSYNGVISIGKAMIGTELMIIDDDSKMLTAGQKGELCISSIQLTPGYWKNEKKNHSSFFQYKGKRFYRTGDLCSLDTDGDFAYIGRIDFQTKVNGFRVELSEIEYHVKSFFENINCVAVAWLDVNKNAQIGLVLETSERKIENLLEYLKTKLPPYMIPIKTLFISKLPYNSSGKTDRNALKELF